MPNMKAVRIHRFGGPEVLQYEDVPRPTPGPGELLIKVKAAAVNPLDWKVCGGHLQTFLPVELPYIPGRDLSGVVAETGPGVAHFKVGDEVYGRTEYGGRGTYAQYAIATESEVASKPARLGHTHIAAIPQAALTAWQALFDKAQLHSGQKILIHSAAGGVGVFAAQFARVTGAHIVGTASARNLPLLQELGVHETIDYASTSFDEAVRDFDVVLDTMGGDTQERSWKVLKKGGILVSLIHLPPAEAKLPEGARADIVYCQSNASQLADIGKLVDTGQVKPIVDTVLTLEEARRAHEMSATGHRRGKIVLEVA